MPNSDSTTVEESKQTFRVVGSFYVEAATAADAERLVDRDLNSGPVQRLVGETVGCVDVHDGDAEPWDMNG